MSGINTNPNGYSSVPSTRTPAPSAPPAQDEPAVSLAPMRDLTDAGPAEAETGAEELPIAGIASGEAEAEASAAVAETPAGFDPAGMLPWAAVAAAALALTVAVLFLLRRRKRRAQQLEHEASMKPLTPAEAAALSKARTVSWINKSFRFSRVPFDVNPGYRERLEDKGRWMRIDIDMRRVPAFVAGLLRREENPWRVWILADDEAGKYMWCSLGEECPVAAEDVVRLARRQKCPTVFAARYVPAGPLEPTRSDLDEAEALKRLCFSAGLNAVSLLAGQGSFSTVSYAFCPGYAAPGCSVEDILAESRKGGQANRRLRLEMRALERSRIDL